MQWAVWQWVFHQNQKRYFEHQIWLVSDYCCVSDWNLVITWYTLVLQLSINYHRFTINLLFPIRQCRTIRICSIVFHTIVWIWSDVWYVWEWNVSICVTWFAYNTLTCHSRCSGSSTALMTVVMCTLRQHDIACSIISDLWGTWIVHINIRQIAKQFKG
jgi:hypothetical protein